MINTSENTEKKDFNRRKFLEYFAALGISSAILPSCARRTFPEENELTVEMIKAAEKLMGITLTEKERKDILKGLNKNLKIYKLLREMKIDAEIPPSFVFNPISAGMTFSREKKPVKFSEVDIKRPNKIEDAAFFSVLQFAQLIQTGQITSMELTKMYLSRLKRYNSKLKFAVNFTEDLALKQAKRADEEIQAGKYRGHLHGIPYGLKDLFSVKGYPTTWGTKVFKDRIINCNASVYQKLEEAGAVLLAKLSTGTLASGNSWFGGVTKNPWNPRAGSGGSSAGPGSATAAGCVGFSIGTETNGSMVSPCDECGVTGLRPTFGRVSRYGAMTTSWSFDKVAPICRTVEDCAVVFNVIYGPDGKDNSIIDLPFNWNPDEFDIRKLKIGYHTKFFEKELMKRDDNYAKAIRSENRKVLDFFREQNIYLIPLDFEIPLTKGADIIMETESSAAADEFSRGKLDDLVKDQKWPRYYRQFRFVPSVEYIQSSRYRYMIMEEWRQAFKDIDVMIEITWSNNWTTNLTGHPIVVVPCGFISKNRPTSVTFVGKLFGEAELLAVAKTFQDATGYHLKQPDI